MVLQRMILAWLVLGLAGSWCVAAGRVRSTAVVDLSFDGKAGAAVDRAAAGAAVNNGRVVAGARRVVSPFWNQAGGRALLTNAGAKQHVVIGDSLDTDRGRAISLAFFFINLHAPGDGAFHGLVAKRAADKAAVTNYGLNFKPQGDALQLYVNDGSGFRIAVFGSRDTLATRRRVHLLATFELTDAPAPDADNDADDVLVRLYVNGRPAKPKPGGERVQQAGNDTWLLDVKPAGLLNNAPLVLGASTPSTEFTSGVFDEFLLFDRALSGDEAAALFTELAGPDAADLARAEARTPPAIKPAPSISNLSTRGLQAGTVSTLTVTGKNLSPGGRLLLPIAGAVQESDPGSNAERLVIKLTLPAGAAAGIYPLRVQTPGGVSNALPVAIDHLAQRSATGSTVAKPAALPAAFFGTLGGPQIARIYVAARRGQRLVADVEARRLGAGIEPVIEIKTVVGTPLAIEWSKVVLRGDTRAEVTIPADGIYLVELHDLAYKAKAGSPFRLKIGDLKLVDAVFPPAATAGSQVSVEPVGSGLAEGLKFQADLRTTGLRSSLLVPLPAEGGFAGPSPLIRISNGREVIEPVSTVAGQETPPIDARFDDKAPRPVTINGRISKPGERDRFRLTVTPGRKLRLSIRARALDSPLDARLEILDGDQVLAASDDRPGSRDPALEYTPAAEVSTIEVAVADLHGRGGSQFLYRLSIASSGTPSFSLQLRTSQLNLPRTGTALVRLNIVRSGYNGPIRLSVSGDKQVTIAPEQLPDGLTGPVFATLVRRGGGEENSPRELRIIGESTDGTRRIAQRSGVGLAVPGYGDLLLAGIAGESGVDLVVAGRPPTLLKGLPARVTVVATGSKARQGQAVRMSLLTNEPARRVNPRDPKAGNKPMVRARPQQALPANSTPGTLELVVPADVAVGVIDFVIRGDVVPHGFSPSVLGTVYSQPFRLSVQNAVQVTFDPKTTTLISGVENKLRGTVTRTPGFDGPVDILINIDKRLGGYATSKVTVPAGTSAFELVIKAGQENEPRVIPGTTLSVSATGGGPLLPNRPIELRVKLPKKAAK